MSKSNTNDLNNEKGNSSRNFRNDSPRSSLNPMNRRNDTNSASTASRDQFYYGPGPSSSLGNSSRNSRESDRMLDDEYPYLEEPTTNDRQYRLGTQHSVEDTTVEKRYKNEVFEALKNQFRESCGMDLPEADMNTPNEMRSNSNASTSRFSGSPSSEEMGTNQACSSSSNPVNLNTSRVEQESGSDETFAVNSLPARHKLGIPKNNFKWLPRQSTTNANKIRAANAVEANPLGWQANKTTLKERIAFMFCNDTLADVYFMVGKHEEKQRVPAHKFVLSIGSVVFDAMFNGCLTTDHKPGEIMEIDLPDVEPFAFLTLLRFLYTDEVNIGPESVMTTLYTAKKYAVPAMEITCVEFLKQSLGADNAFMLLSQARLFDEPQLEHLCLELIDRDTYEALNGEGFTEIDHETLCLVLGRDSLRIKESSLFQAVMRWANEACLRKGLDVTVESQREVLGCALHLIRYPLMSLEEFAQTAAQSGLLDDREVVELFLYFSVNPKPNTCFTSRPRCAVAGKELIVSRFQRNEVRWGYTGTADRIKFNVDKKIYIVGFGLFGSIAGTHDYPVTIQITECGTEKIIAHHETTFTSDGSSQTFKVHFREPVEITPSITYTASALLKGADTHYGTKGLRRVTHTSPNGDTVTFQFTYAAGNNNGTSVEDGQIPEIIFFTQLS